MRGTFINYDGTKTDQALQGKISKSTFPYTWAQLLVSILPSDGADI